MQVADDLLTLSEAAALTGLDVRAVRRRADRGTLRVQRRGGVRVVSVAELERAGLLGPQEGDVKRLAERVYDLEKRVEVLERNPPFR